MKRLLPLIALVGISVYANQQTVKISPGFFSGKDYLENLLKELPTTSATHA